MTRLEYLNKELEKAKAHGNRNAIKLATQAVAEEQTEQKQLAEASVAPLVADYNKNLRKLNREQRAASLTAYQLNKEDPYLQVPTPKNAGDSHYSKDDVPAQITADIKKAKKQFDEYLNENGVKLSKAATKTFLTYVRNQTQADLRIAATWQVCLNQCVNLGLIPNVEINIPQEPEPEVPEVSIDKIDDSTVAGRKEVKERLQRDSGREKLANAKPVYDQFIDELKSRDVYLTEQQQRDILDYVINDNKRRRSDKMESWQKALAVLFPQYLSGEQQDEIQEFKDLEEMESGAWGRKYGMRVNTYAGTPAYAEDNVTRD